MQIQKPKQGYKLVKSLFGKYEEIPDNWNLEEVGKVFKITMGQSPPSESYNQKKYGLPFYQGVTDFGTIYPKPTLWCSDPKKTAKEDNILFSVRAPVGETNINESECCLGRGVAAFDPKTNNLFYSYYLVTYNKKRFSVYSQGTTYDAINKDEIARTKLPFSDNKKEQQKIASILSNVDSLIQQTQKEIELTQRLKKGLMQRLLTKGIGHSKFKKVKLLFGKEEKIPEEWELKKLKEVAKLSVGGTPSRNKTDFWNDGTIPWIASGEVHQRLIFDTREKITKLGLDNSSAKIHPKHTVLVAIIGQGVTRGKTAILKIDASFNQDFVGIVCQKETLDEFFLFYYLENQYWNLRNISQGTQQGHLNKDLLSQYRIFLPKKQEQQKISNILSNIDCQLQKQQECKSKLETLKKGLMQKLLTGQIRVKV